MSSGYIKIHRSIKKWEWYDDINTRIVFLHILLSANHAQTKWRSLTIKPGQYKTDLRSLADEVGITLQSLRTSLDKLKSTHEITIKTTNKYSVISVNKWNEYQSINTQLNKRVTNKQQTTNTPTRGLKNEKNEKNEKKERKKLIQKKGESLVSADSFFSSFKESESKRVSSKAKKYDLREKDIVYFAEQAEQWCIGSEVEDNTWVWWDSFFNRWILRGSRQHKERLPISEREKKKGKKKVRLSKEDKEALEILKTATIRG